ncbi:PEP-CTERM protein-sorting domain-containing protein [Parasphingorhabdus marina DSM 22363]|uniref:PEP-CTERM protein-sorting domain-containing protein n=1 Tax=Parasphingorhabdus marina DSM 22363 TaxID=1123272 RepID=A0A1N6GJA7_9SPHN|nr:PEPxxWA-CTERM sorting domain-containing protein [Parasphingorhabdus marina]SIO07613.1 PEP-CTERM protein-sorting domain-containing protein [Parasphingorhabdus marina DSM 22363]
MIKLMKFALAGALAVTAMAPAHAAFVFNFNGGNSSLTGPDGNGRIFSATDNGMTINVRASAWSINTSNVVRNGYLGHYSSGLGVTNRNEGSSGHVADNSVSKDFILLQFDQAVDVNGFRLNFIDEDSDIVAGFNNVNFAWNAAVPNLDNQNVAALNALFPSLIDYNGGDGGNNSSSFRSVNAANNSGNFWLVGPKFSSSNDSFKLGLVKADFVAPPPAIPEPGTWAMMIIGFGAIGGAMRSRRRKSAMKASIA